MRGDSLHLALTTTRHPGDRALRIAASRESMPLQVSVHMPPG